jgi:hypothetical protein
MQIEEENWPAVKKRANISKITKVQAVMHYCKTDPSLFTTGAPQVAAVVDESDEGSITVSDWPEKHCVFALWKRVSSGGYALTFVRVEGTWASLFSSQFVSTKNAHFINQECWVGW